VVELESTVKTLTAERDAAKSQLERDAQAGAKNQAEVEALSKTLAEKTAQIQTLEESIKEKETVISSSKVQINKLKTLGRTYKEKFEKTEEEVAEKAAALAKVEEELKKARENPVQAGSSEAAETGSIGDDKLAEAELLVSLFTFLFYSC
jgi:chromosome segregation ATPase